MVTTQQVPGMVVQVLAEGGPRDLENLEVIDRLYQEGDLGELQLFLTPDISAADAREALERLELTLQEEGVQPWPGYTRIGEIEGTTVRFRFVKTFGLLAFLVPVLIATISVAIARFPGPVVSALGALGIDVSPEAVSAIAGAVAIITGLIALRGAAPWLFALIPTPLLLIGGLLLFVYLSGWRALKWVAQQALKLLEGLGIKPLPLALGLAAGVTGLFFAWMGLRRVLEGR